MWVSNLQRRPQEMNVFSFKQIRGGPFHPRALHFLIFKVALMTAVLLGTNQEQALEILSHSRHAGLGQLSYLAGF